MRLQARAATVAADLIIPAMRPGPVPLLRLLDERPLVAGVAVRFRRAR